MSERYFIPRNWEKHQGYKKRGPKWIRNYVALLDDPKYLDLNEGCRGALHGLWLLYARAGRPLPLSSTHTARQLGISSQAATAYLKALLSNEFIELVPESVATVVDECDKTSLARDRVRVRVRDKERTPSLSPPGEKRKPSDPVFDEFWEMFPRQRRGSKEKAHRAWLKALTRSSAGDIMIGLRDYVASDEVRDGFSKGAAAWLNDDRWASDYRTFRKKTADEMREEFLHGDEGSGLGSGAIDGQCVEVPGGGPEGNGVGIPLGTAGLERQPASGLGGGVAEQLGEAGPAQAGGLLPDSERTAATIAELAKVAAKRAKPRGNHPPAQVSDIPSPSDRGGPGGQEAPRSLEELEPGGVEGNIQTPSGVEGGSRLDLNHPDNAEAKWLDRRGA